MHAVLDSHQRLAYVYELILVEGSGSPAENNLREGDIANMGFADAAGNSSVLQQTWPGVKPGHAHHFFN